MSAHLELLARLLVDMRRAIDGEARDRGRERDRARDLRPGATGRVDDLRRRLVEDPVIVGLLPDSDFVVFQGLALARA